MIDKLSGGREMCSNCCCRTRIQTREGRNLFTSEEIKIVRAFNEEFLRCFGRLPAVEERRFLEEVLQVSRLFKDEALY